MFSYLERCKKVMVLGIGGGGDIFATIPSRNFFKRLGLDVYVGCVAWERFIVDPKPGPRPLEELMNVEVVSETVCIGGPKTMTKDGVRFQASALSEKLGTNFVLVDITKGVEMTAKGIEEAMRKLDVDLLVGVDAGGDVLARGGEENLRSPLCDSVMLASMRRIRRSNFIGVFAPACDGELTLNEILNYISEIASMGGYLGAYGMCREDAEVLDGLVKDAASEVTRIAVSSFKGLRGEVAIREGLWRAEASIISTITFYLDTNIVYDLSRLAKAVADSRDVYEANQRLNELGIKTELDIELEAQRKGARTYRELFMK